MKRSEDTQLREAFRELRRVESAGAPSFARTLAAARARKAPRVFGWRPLAAAAVVLAIVLWLVPRPAREPVPTAARFGSLGAWATPTDVLLETPGHSLLRELPQWEVLRTGSLREGDESTSRSHRRIRV